MGSAPNNYQNPKTDWAAGNIPTASDFNRIEGNIQAVEENARTIDPAQAPTSNTGSLRQLLDWLANRIRAITGKANWYDNPDITLATLAAHKSRHASGGPDALTPADIGAASQTALDAHANRTDNPHNVTAAQLGASNILTQIKTVDGPGSGLDADTVDGVHLSGLAQISDNPANIIQPLKKVCSLGVDLNYLFVDGNYLYGLSGTTVYKVNLTDYSYTTIAGCPSSSLLSLLVKNSEIYVFYSATNTLYIAKHNGSSWVNLTSCASAYSIYGVFSGVAFDYNDVCFLIDFDYRSTNYYARTLKYILSSNTLVQYSSSDCSFLTNGNFYTVGNVGYYNSNNSQLFFITNNSSYLYSTSIQINESGIITSVSTLSFMGGPFSAALNYSGNNKLYVQSYNNYNLDSYRSTLYYDVVTGEYTVFVSPILMLNSFQNKIYCWGDKVYIAMHNGLYTYKLK